MSSEELIFYGGLLTCTLYLIYSIIMQTNKSNDRDTIISNAEKEYDLASRDLNVTKQKLVDEIIKAYGQEKADMVSNGTIWVGMPMYLLMITKGKANDIKESIYKETTTEKWYYGEYQTRIGTYKYKLEVTLENNEVVGWKDLV